MAFGYQCAACGHAGQAGDQYAGRIVKCPQCGQPVELPPPPPSKSAPSESQEFDRDFDEFVREQATFDPEPPPVVTNIDRPAARPKRFAHLLFFLGLTSACVAAIGFAVAVHTGHPYMTLGAFAFLAGLCGLVVCAVSVFVRGYRHPNPCGPTSIANLFKGCVAGCLLCGACFVATKHSANGLATVVHYSALLLGVYMPFEAVRRWRGLSYVRWIGMVAAIVSAFAWLAFDYRIEEWTGERSKYDAYESHFVDYHRRFRQRHFYRKMRLTKPGAFLTYYSTEGPVSESGKQHGRWHWRSFDWDAEPLRVESGDNYYWYGEKVTEGEWHMRDR